MNMNTTLFGSLFSQFWWHGGARCSANTVFLRATAATAVMHLSHRNSVCLFIRLSHGWISPKRCKLGSLNLHCRLPGRL